MLFHGKHFWALILGGSSGFGLASAKKLSEWGMNIFLVHRDRRGAMVKVEEQFDAIRKTGVAFQALNLDALRANGRTEALTQLNDTIGDGRVRVLLHSIAAGRLKRFAPPRSTQSVDALQSLATALGESPDAVQTAVESLVANGVDELAPLLCESALDGSSLATEEDMAASIQAMGFDLLFWVQEIQERGLFADDARVMALTSEGSTRVWPGYGPVSAAKATLEAVVRSISMEFAPFGIKCNLLQPGVTDTPALKVIPGAKAMMSRARQRNPLNRLTRPEDVADVVALLSMDEASWINGACIRVDGGEFIVA